MKCRICDDDVLVIDDRLVEPCPGCLDAATQNGYADGECCSHIECYDAESVNKLVTAVQRVIDFIDDLDSRSLTFEMLKRDVEEALLP